MKRNKRIQNRINKIPEDVDIFVNTSFEIADRIHSILIENDMEQKDLAITLGKSEAEISKWLSGTHNFTIRTLAKIQTALKKEIIEVTGKPKQIHYVFLPDKSAKITPSNKYNEIREFDFDLNTNNAFIHLSTKAALVV